MAPTKVTKDIAAKTLLVERVFDAPRQRVWDAFANADKLAKWWGPRGWETTITQFEFKPGGTWLYCMKCVDKDQGDFYGQESWGKAVYQDINEPESFTYKDYFADADGTINLSMPVMTIAMEFIDMDGKTKLVSRSVFETEEGLTQVVEMGVVEGITQTWDRLEELVTG